MAERLHRTRVLSVRLNEAEWQTLDERADLCGIALSAYVRDTALGKTLRQRPHRVERQAIYHLGRIGNNLNQLARHANAARRVELSRRLDEVLAELLTAIRRLA